MTDSTTSKGYNIGRKFDVEKKEGLKCFNSRRADHFSRGCKIKRVANNEDYEAKYKNLLASLKRHNIDANIILAEVENWVDDKESSNEE